MREFLIAPAGAPDWAIDPPALVAGMRERWPQSAVREYTDGRPMTHEVTVDFPDSEFLAIWIMSPPDTLHAETFDVGKLGEFIEWWVQRAPGFDPDVRIYDTTDPSRSLPLTAGTTAEQVVVAFA